MGDILASMAAGNRCVDVIEAGVEKRFYYTLEIVCLGLNDLDIASI